MQSMYSNQLICAVLYIISTWQVTYWIIMILCKWVYNLIWSYVKSFWSFHKNKQCLNMATIFTQKIYNNEKVKCLNSIIVGI